MKPSLSNKAIACHANENRVMGISLAVSILSAAVSFNLPSAIKRLYEVPMKTVLWLLAGPGF
jgi:hypothetical protein